MAMEAWLRRCMALGALAAGLAQGAWAADRQAAAAPGFKRLHYFAGDDGHEGFGPYGALVVGADGNLYGTAFYGGPEEFRCDCSVGGTLYRMTPAGAYTMLHGFMGSDGIGPTGGLAIGPDGAFYGTTSGGGTWGAGTAFRLDATGAFSVLHHFGGPGGEGGRPWLGALALGADGNFYGVTSRGGAGQRGALFRMTPAGDVTVLHAFAGGPADGATPRGGVMFASDGNVYGTTLCGGTAEPAGGCAGTVWRWSATAGFAVVHSFDPGAAMHDGYAPQAAPTELRGYLYGTASLGGDAGAGAVWRIPLAGGALQTLHGFGGGVASPIANGDGRAPVGRLVVAGDGRLYGTTSNGGPNRVVHPEGDGTIFSIGTDGSYATVFAFGSAISYGSHPIAGLVKGKGGTLYGVTESGNANFTGLAYSWVPGP
jgi:uncharacterized repeat protein (TIGR03803 family)